MKSIYLVAPVLSAVIATQANALNILVTNDDGCNSTGLAAVATALTNAGHTITVVAPSRNQSGMGTRQALPDTSAGYTTATFNVTQNASGYNCVALTMT